ncbi:hypothetical protein ABZ070_35130 [Streptomyces sp. NPDC006283]|uniref:hypothetical protein n=1 Tax=Streptomyces sp. NPDC006283 TaxID=3156741 RepID=UPI0033B46F64
MRTLPVRPWPALQSGDALTGHVRSSAQMLSERQGERLPQWLDAVRQDDLTSSTLSPRRTVRPSSAHQAANARRSASYA